MVLFIVIPAAALSRFFVLVRVLVAGGASVLVVDLVLVAGVVDFGAACAAATLRCLRFFQLKVIVLVLCVGGVLVGFPLVLKVLVRFVVWQIQVSVLLTMLVVGLGLFLAPSELIGRSSGLLCASSELMGWCYLVLQTS